jgi:hypothetical protein
MDKKAVMYTIGGLVLILLVALVVKPLVTGQPLNIGLPSAATPIPAMVVTTPGSGTIDYSVVPVTSVKTVVPTPVPTWNRNVMKVQFVNPSTYGISLNQSLPNGTRIDSVGRNTSRIIFATVSGQYSATTQVMRIPFPYW